MTQLTNKSRQTPMFGPRIMTMALAGFLLVSLHWSTAHAQQWATNGNNINNTNTGNVGIGTTEPGEVVHVRKDQNGETHLLVENATAGPAAYADLKIKNNLGHFAQFGLYSSSTTPVGALSSDNAFAYTTSPAIAIIANNTSGILKFATGGLNERMRIDASGNVGIGTTTPSDPVQVDTVSGWGVRIRYTVDGQYLRLSANQVSSFTSAGAPRDLYLNPAGGNIGVGTASPIGRLDVRQIGNGGAIGTIVSSYGPNEDTFVRGGSSSAAVHIGDLTATTSKLLLMENGGNVGIGKTNPAAKLDVNGNVSVTGNITATGTINATYQDVAEWVESSQLLSPGTVVVLDQTKSNQVIASSQAYDTRVAGVISLQPGITLGQSGTGKVLVATTGRVKVKVDASAGPIQVGDLLVTSDKEGEAKKSEPLILGGVQIHRPGTLIGKALEPLEKGTGEILVLLSLQ